MPDIISPLAPQIADLVANSRNILVNIHVGADYDSLGSAVGLKYILENLGKKVDLYSPEDIDSEIRQNSDSLFGSPSIISGKFYDLDFKKYDLFFCLDSENLFRISRFENITLPLPVKTVVIDHHPHNQGFGDINLIVPGNTCTSELVYKLSQANNWHIPKQAAVCLFVGLWSDTGQFMYPGTTTADSHRTAAGLIDLGEINSPKLIWSLRRTDDRALKSAGIALSRSELFFSNQVIFVDIEFTDLEKTGLDPSFMGSVKEFIAHNLSYTTRPSIIAIVYQKGDNWYKISFRSNNLSNLKDISLIARKFPGGGGHPRAAGADVQMSLADAKKLVLEKIQETYPDLGEP